MKKYLIFLILGLACVGITTHFQLPTGNHSAPSSLQLNSDNKTDARPDKTTAITLMSWNLEWLTLTPFKYAPPRDAADYQALARIFADVSPDILAFQEVDSLEVLQKIVPHTQYQFFLSDRADKPDDIFRDVNQYTGFAVRNGLIVKDIKDLAMMNLNLSRKPTKLRYTSHITIQSSPTTQPVHLLSVHLKSGCYSLSHAKASSQKVTPCKVLTQQLHTLSQWLDDHQDQFVIIAGDFNYRLSSTNTWLQDQLNLSTPKVVSLTKNTQANCYIKQIRQGKTHYRRYKHLIDHIFLSSSLADIHENTLQSAVQYRYPKADVKQYQLTDHCPIISRIQIP